MRHSTLAHIAPRACVLKIGDRVLPTARDWQFVVDVEVGELLQAVRTTPALRIQDPLQGFLRWCWPARSSRMMRQAIPLPFVGPLLFLCESIRGTVRFALPRWRPAALVKPL